MGETSPSPKTEDIQTPDYLKVDDALGNQKQDAEDGEDEQGEAHDGAVHSNSPELE